VIAKLRRRHRRTWVLLAVVLAAIMVAAWFARRPAQVMERLPEVLTKATSP
jgi:hypothetical protein